MKKFKFLSLGTLMIIGTVSSSFAQDYTDALRYSYLSPTGTARAMGFGNALGSVGGDFSSLSVNPAGIGIYKSSDFMMTPSLKINSVTGEYINNNTSSSNTRFNFNNIGAVFTTALKGRRTERSSWKSFSFGIGMNRLADFNRDYTYTGNNYSSSQTQAMAADANVNNSVGTPGSLGDWGWQSYLIDTGNGLYHSIVDPSKGIRQYRSLSERGGINELVISFGGNYMDQLMLGATIGIPVVNYTRNCTYSEHAIGTDSSGFNSYTYSENLTTTGSGINLKLGLIYKPSDYFRLGVAIHTPTYYSLHDDWGSALTSNTVANGSVTPSPVNGSYDYNMTTPWRAILSATGFLGTHGFITADYEYVDYTSASLQFQGGDFIMQQNANNQIKTILQAASNFRVGVEGRLTNFFMLRVGYGYMGSPYKNSGAISASANTISGGFGFRFDHWYLDAALSNTTFNGLEQPYSNDISYPAVPVATLKNSLNNASLTVGFKF